VENAERAGCHGVVAAVRLADAGEVGDAGLVRLGALLMTVAAATTTTTVWWRHTMTYDVRHDHVPS